MYTVKQVFFIMAPGTRGISPPKVRAEKTRLLGIYAVLTYIFIIFLRNTYHIHGFSKNSLSFAYVCWRFQVVIGGLHVKTRTHHHGVRWLTFVSAQTQF